MQETNQENKMTETKNSFDRIIGYEAIKEELLRICDILKDTGKYRRLGAVPPRGLLLEGMPGLGKTEMAKCVLAESGRKAFIIRKDRPDGEFIDKIREVFKEAREAAPSIVLLDDLDKFADNGKEEFSVVQACMDDCRGHEVFVIATANMTRNLPGSLLRAGRLEKQLRVLAPKEEDAVEIVKYYLKDKQFADDIEPEEIARLFSGNSCAQMEAALNEAAIYAGYNGRECIGRQEILQTCVRCRSGEPSTGVAEDNPVLDTVAVHEAGHVVAAEILKPGRVTYAYACVGFSGGLGHVVYRNFWGGKNWEDMENDIIVSLSSKAAIEIVKGVTDVGCNSDLQKAYQIAEGLADDYCTFGFDTFERHNSSEHLHEEKDRLIAMEVNNCYRRAKKLLIDNRKFLDAAIKELKKRNIITYKEIAVIKQNVGLAG